MKLIFVDSDILLDGILARAPFFEPALNLLSKNGKDLQICTSFHSLLNVHYLARKYYNENYARRAVRELAGQLTIIAEDKLLIENALNSDFLDFEDAIQYFAALSAKADAIITRNTKDYKHAAIPVLTAEQFLRKIA